MRACSTSAAAPAAWPRPRRARPSRDRRSTVDPELAGGARAGARPRGTCAVDAVVGRRALLRARRRRSTWCSRRCSSSSCFATRRSGVRDARRASRATCGPAACSPLPCSTSTGRRSTASTTRRCPTCASATAGSTRASRSRSACSTAATRSALDRVRRGRLARRRAVDESVSQVRLELLSPDAARDARHATAGLDAAERRSDPADRGPRRQRRRARRDGPPRWLSSELRVLWLYPDHMNIYADRGNIAVLERRCRWRGIGFELAPRRARRRGRPRRARPLLHGRRPGPRPGAGRARPGRDQARGARSGASTGGRRDAGRLRRLPAARALLRAAGRRVAARPRPGRPAHGARARAAADRQRRDRGRPRRRPAAAGRLREPRRPHLPRRGEQPLGRVVSGFGNNGKRRPRGRAARAA